MGDIDTLAVLGKNFVSDRNSLSANYTILTAFGIHHKLAQWAALVYPYPYVAAMLKYAQTQAKATPEKYAAKGLTENWDLPDWAYEEVAKGLKTT